MLGGPGSDLFDVVIRMDGLDDFALEWERAAEIRIGKVQLKVLPLERILVSKRAANRPKDKRVVAVLQNALFALQDGRKQQPPRKRRGI